MHAFVYQFQPKPGKEAEFVEAWKHVTEGIKKYRGGLGSCLHRDEKGNWIAYAQWPSKEMADKKVETPAEHQAWVKKLNDSVERIQVLFSLGIVENLLDPLPPKNS